MPLACFSISPPTSDSPSRPPARLRVSITPSTTASPPPPSPPQPLPLHPLALSDRAGSSKSISRRPRSSSHRPAPPRRVPSPPAPRLLETPLHCQLLVKEEVKKSTGSLIRNHSPLRRW